MLEAYQSLLTRLRQDESAWPEVAHHAIYHEDERMEDPHYRQRYGLLLCLQYDRRDEDDALVRYLLQEESKSRLNDPFQGESSAVLLAAYLLSCRRQIGDVWLLWQAKSANFDTFCAVDTMYLFAAGIGETLDYLKASDRSEASDLLQFLFHDPANPAIPTAEELEQFWQQKQQAYPTDPSQEDPLTLARRAWELDQIEEGRRWLDRWQAQQPGTERTLHTLMYTRGMLGQPAQALVCANRLLEMAGTDVWKQASAQFEAGRRAVEAAEFEQAWKMLEQTVKGFQMHPERHFLGQHIATLELALNIGQAAPPEHPLRHKALQQTHALIEQGFSTSYNILKGMSDLAGALEETVLARRYQDLAAAERRRIDRRLAGESE